MADYKDQLLAGIAQPKPCQAPKLLYKTGEAMAAIGCGNTKFYELINDGTLDARRFGRRTYVTGASLARFVETLKRVVTPTMAKAALEAQAEGGDPQPLEADTGADRQSSRKRFTSLAPRPPAAE